MHTYVQKIEMSLDTFIKGVSKPITYHDYSEDTRMRQSNI